MLSDSDRNNSDDVPPPSYAPPNRRRTSAQHPQPTTPREPTEHTFSLTDGRGGRGPWATLTLLSSAPARALPSYFDGQTVHGRVSFSLSKPEAIQAVTVVLSGAVVATNANPFAFWEMTRTLWSVEMGDPRAAAAAGGEQTQGASARGKFTGKLVGEYAWPFAIQLPSTCSVALRPKQPPVTLSLPPSFSERGAAQFINYEINVRIRRGPLRIDSKLGTQFGFAPRVRPSPPSMMRRLAYQENAPLLGPANDPDGWEVLPPLAIGGRIFGVRTFEAACTFGFALPLAYARGSPIPCVLSIACADAQALDLVFAPTGLCVCLVREVVYDGDGSSTTTIASAGGTGSGSGRAHLQRAASTSTSSTTSSTFSSTASPWSTLRPGPLDSSPADASLVVSASAPAPTPLLPPLFARGGSFSTRALLAPLALSRVSTAASAGASSAGEGLGSARSSVTRARRRGASDEGAGAEGAAAAQRLALRGVTKVVASAVWWPASSAPPPAPPPPPPAGGGVNPVSPGNSDAPQAQRYHTRRMEGEIMLPKDLVPSFEFGGFSVSYALAILPIIAPSFEPHPYLREPLVLARDVQVCTQHAPAPAPVPRSRTPGSGYGGGPGEAAAAGCEAQRAAHQARLARPMVWGLYST